MNSTLRPWEETAEQQNARRINETLKPLFDAIQTLNAVPNALPVAIEIDQETGEYLKNGVVPITIPYKDGSEAIFYKAVSIQGEVPYIELKETDENGEEVSSGPVIFSPLSISEDPTQAQIAEYDAVIDWLAERGPQNIDLSEMSLQDYPACFMAVSLRAEPDLSILEKFESANNEAGLLLLELTEYDIKAVIDRISRLNQAEGLPDPSLALDPNIKIAIYTALSRSGSFPQITDLDENSKNEYRHNGMVPRENIEAVYNALLVTGLVRALEDGTYSINPLLSKAVELGSHK